MRWRPCDGANFATDPRASGRRAEPGLRDCETRVGVFTLADYRGKNVVLGWTNPECPFVRKHCGKPVVVAGSVPYGCSVKH
jgi:hypothetical protein